MQSPGFLPLRQLVLVDLLGLLLGTRPGERAVIAVDGADATGRRQLVAELVALAPHVAGRTVQSWSADGEDEELRRVVSSFLAERPRPDGSPGLAPDAVLLVEGRHLRRGDLGRSWSATCLVVADGVDYGPDDLDYVRQARTVPPTWIVDTTDQQRPELVEPDPEEPQWFGAPGGG